MKKIIAKVLLIVFCVSMILPTVALAENETSNSDNKTVSIMFTGDMHSHLESINGEGGFAKLKTAVDNILSKDKNSFLFDAGNFSMGTLYQTIYKSQASELVMMGALGYDAITIGGNEFNYGESGLAAMINKAAQNKKTEEKTTEAVETTEINQVTENVETNEALNQEEQGETQVTTTIGSNMPTLVSSNIDWEKTLNNKKLKKNGNALKKAFTSYGVEDYTIIEKGDIKIAVFGVMGEESIAKAGDGLKWQNYIERSKEIVNEIKRNGEADLIVALSNSGIDKDKKSGENIELAKEVPDIDVVVSGNNDTALEKPILEGKTIIVSSGEDTNALGHLVIEKDGDGYKVKSYDLVKLDKKIAENTAIKSGVLKYRNNINSEYLGKYGYYYGTMLANNNIDFTKIENFGDTQKEETLGNLLSDSLIYGVKKAEGNKYEKVDVALVSAGTIKASINRGNVTTADIFDILPLGEGKDHLSGYPLVSVYLTGKELKNVAEADISVSPKKPESTIYASGLSYTFNKHRLFLNKTTDVKLDLGNGKYENLDKDKLYRVVGDLYTCKNLGNVSDLAKGFLKIVPKDKSGNAITDYNKQIIYNGNNELKEWYATAAYVDSFENNQIPSKYTASENRKIDDTSWNPWKIIKQPNQFGLIVVAIILIPIVIIIGIILYIRKKRHYRRGYGKSMFAKNKKRPKGGKPQFKGKKIKRRYRRY